MIAPLLPANPTVAVIGPLPAGAELAGALKALGLGARFLRAGAENPELAGEALAAADLAILALGPVGLPPLLDLVATRCRPGALVLDLCPVKESALEAADRVVPLGLDFLSMSLLPGRPAPERSGESALPYGGRTVVFVPSMCTRPEAIERARQLWERLGARILQRLPDEHDALVAGVVQLPGLALGALASALAELYANDPEIARFLGPLFQGPAASVDADPAVAAAELHANRESLAVALDALIDHLGLLGAALASGEETASPALVRILRSMKASLDPLSDRATRASS